MMGLPRHIVAKRPSENFLYTGLSAPGQYDIKLHRHVPSYIFARERPKPKKASIEFIPQTVVMQQSNQLPPLRPQHMF